MLPPVPGLSEIVFLLLFLLFLVPALRQRALSARRLRALRQLEQQRGSRVITLIHREEQVSLLGIPLRRFIDIEDSEQVLRAIRLTPDTVPIDLIVHSPGGLVLAAEQIARALHRHPAKVTVIVPHYAMSGGTMLALAADEILMDENAVLGPVDPQIGQWPAASIINVAASKPLERVNDETLMLADIAKKAQQQVKEFVMNVLLDDFPEERANQIAEQLTGGRWTHDYPLTFEALAQIGLPVSQELVPDVFALMDLYPQVGRQRPSVQYVPIPYREPLPTRKNSGFSLAGKTGRSEGPSS
jgi:ClpP class serine protease